MQKTENNTSPISPLLRGLSLVEVFVLLGAGIGLFLMPAFTRDIWMWKLLPFNSRFLGAIYWSAMVSIAFMVWAGRWSPTRAVLRAIFVFTLVVLGVSLLYSDQFNYDRATVWGWFGLYIILPLSAGYHLWLYRNLPNNHLTPTAPAWRFVLGVGALFMLVYGLGLLFVPNTFSKAFPWALAEFDARLYSATFLAGAVWFYTVQKASTPLEFMTVGMTEGIFGLLAIIGLLITDADVHRLDWSAPKTWIWLVFFGFVTLLGAAMTITGWRAENKRI
jgi:hypothetical protein